MKKRILIVTGEPSGDVRAAELVKELNALMPGCSYWGIGGDRMKSEGVVLAEHIRNLSIVGIWEALVKLPLVRRQYNDLAERIRSERPDLAILVDYPGFNLKVARLLHKENIPVIYYIIPQVWAWGRGRIRTIRACVDKALVLFDFEEKLLKENGIDCEFTGHPLIDAAGAESFPGKSPGPVRSPEKPFTVALLPGSRKSEIQNLLPLMLDTAEKLLDARADMCFVIAENSNVDSSLYDAALAGHERLGLSRVKDNTMRVLAGSDFAIVASGTATLETAVMNVPMIITYRTAFLTALLYYTFVRLPSVGLVNIVAGKQIVPELLQKNATPEKMSEQVLEIINDSSRMRAMKQDLKKAAHALGEKGAVRRAAEAVKRFLEQ
ncbi:MAG: lipid-A-disaccharide synthase [Candidatus Omnitrophota bacterium]